MSTDVGAAGVPQWDVADRMRKALRDGGVGVQQMADYLEVSRNTVGNYINGHTPPPGPVLRLWALRCGVPLGWLKSGEGEGPTPGGLTNPGYVGSRRRLQRVKDRSRRAHQAPLVPLFSPLPAVA